MELLNLEQGTNEWKLSRHEHFTASDASAMMGSSKYKTRNQLLDEKSGDYAEEVIAASKQALFNKGHKAEDDARNVLSVETMDEYHPCVGVSMYYPGTGPSCDPLPLMASFDGRSDDEDHLFEHKLWNETLAENVRNGVLEASHYWQLEHQLLVDDSAKYVLFVVSDGTADKRVMMKYYSLPERRDELILSWAMFQKDLLGHEVEAKVELVEAEKKSLPAITCSVKGSEISTNISVCLQEVKKLAKSEMTRSFESDQDFADKDQLNKDVKKAREQLKVRVEAVKNAFVSYAEFETVAAEMDEVLQKLQSHGEKQVKEAKEAKKKALVDAAAQSLSDYVLECSESINAPFGITSVIQVEPDFKAAVKNKRTIKSLEDSLDTEVNKWKVILATATKLIKPNFEFLEANASEYKYLFHDVFELLNQPTESFQAIVTTRLDARKAEEEKARIAETARIQAEATAKAEAAAAKKLKDEQDKIEANAREKLLADQKAIADHVEAISINSDFDWDKKLKEKREQMDIAPNQDQVNIAKSSAGVVFNGGKFSSEASAPSQVQRTANAIEAQAAHNPLPGDFVLWSRKHNINSIAFMELEELINKHYR